MKNGKRLKLTLGLRWKIDSPFIWFSWRDGRGKQHQKNTETTDPAKALGIKLEFLSSAQQEIEQIKIQSESMGKLPLSRVADLFFEWKEASSAVLTIERERHIFNPVRKFFGSQLPVKAIRLPLIRLYQQQRRQQSRGEYQRRRHPGRRPDILGMYFWSSFATPILESATSRKASGSICG